MQLTGANDEHSEGFCLRTHLKILKRAANGMDFVNGVRVYWEGDLDFTCGSNRAEAEGLLKNRVLYSLF